MPTVTLITGFDRTLRWIAPAGNLGDALLLSSLLRAWHERTGEGFGLVRMRPYSSLLRGHPAVAQLASADALGLPLQRTDYWALPFSGKKAELRPWARLSLLLFGEVMEELRPWAPLDAEDLATLDGLPLPDAPVLVAPGSDSPRMEWPSERWDGLARELARQTSRPPVQVGVTRQKPVAGALNLSGKLRPRALLALAGRARLVLSVDPFLTQAAAMHGTPAVNLFGPTSSRLHGPPGQTHLDHTGDCAAPCLDTDREARNAPCPERRFCLGEIAVAAVLGAVEATLAGAS